MPTGYSAGPPSSPTVWTTPWRTWSTSFSPSFSAFLKGSIEHGSLYRPYGEIPAGLCRSSWNAQACLEYMPTKSRDFRFFLHYNYYSSSPTGYGTSLGIASAQEHRLSLGLIYIMNIF